MFLRKAAIRPVPRFAVIEESAIDSVEELLGAKEDTLQSVLDDGFDELDRKQPALARFLASVISECKDELVQSVGYFLCVSVFIAFREAFPTRLREVDERALEIAGDMLETDEELRASDPHEVLDSDDVVALGQPALLQFVQQHIQEALDQAEEEIELEELDKVYRALLIEVIALSHAVEAPQGQENRALA